MHDLTEALGAFVVVIGLGAIVAAASMISTALAVLAAGVFLVAIGLVAIYAAAALEQRRVGRQPKP